MAYELRLHIGTAHTAMPGYDTISGGRTMSEIATIDLSNPGRHSRIFSLVQNAHQDEALDRFRLYTEAFDEDGDQISVREDFHGRPLVALPLNTVLEALTADLSASKREYGTQGYRRFAIAVTLLGAIRARFDEGDLVVIPFGH